MIVTILTLGDKKHAQYGRQHLGIGNERYYEVPHKLVEELRTATSENVQAIIEKIEDTCDNVK